MNSLTDETTNDVGVAEGPTLSALIAVTKAYSATNAVSMLRRMIRTAGWPSRLAVVASVLAAVGAAAWGSERWVQIFTVSVAFCVYGFKRDSFRSYYIRKPTATFLDTFTRRDQAFRYVMFREKLSNDISADAPLLERLLRLLEQRQKVRHAGLVTRHPIVTTLVALFAMLLGVLISKAVDASVPGIVTATFAALLMIFMAMQLGAIWRTREYRDEELTEFVLWLWAEATERPKTARPQQDER